MKLFEKTQNHTHNIIKICGLKFKHRKKGVNYKVEDLGKNNVIEITGDYKGVIKIKGDNNKIIIKNSKVNNGRIEITGDDNSITLDEIEALFYLNIPIGIPKEKSSKCNLKINKARIGGATFVMIENNTKISIQENCLISREVKFSCTDWHSVTDLDGNLLNRANSIEIGEHVWIGQNAYIGKNTFIPSNCIIGTGAVVTKKFNKENCVIAGNPAQIKKENINWNFKRADMYTPERERERERERVIALRARYSLVA